MIDREIGREKEDIQVEVKERETMDILLKSIAVN